MAKIHLTILCSYLILISSSIQTKANNENSQIVNVNPQQPCNVQAKLDVLPGRGWDNLRNKEMGQVISIDYNQCRLTPDGKYVLPDNAFVAPVKESNVYLFSEIINKWSNYTSITSESFNMGANYDNPLFSISGSFSSEYQSIKKRQVDQKSSTLRVQARYDVYAVNMISTVNLDNEFKTRIDSAIEALVANNTDKTDYILELIVRDYGTHVLTRMDAGAILVKEDFIARTFIESYTDSISKVKAAASTSFFNVFKFDASYNKYTDQSVLDGYMKSTTSSHISTYGGSFFRPNSSVNEWIDTILNNLVAIDRMGVPLHYVIIPNAFPKVSLGILDRLRTELSQAISQYYAYNVHLGCLSMDSPNFDYNANVDSKHCTNPTNNYTFGGAFQNCQGDLCKEKNLFQKNPLTGDYSCPAIYTTIHLKSGTFSKTNCYEECHSSWIFWEKCQTNCYNSQTEYTAFWCAAMGDVPQNTGVMFGGVYNSKVDNQLTGGKWCPPTFIELLILQDVHICVGVDYELGYKYSVPFGGFFSCQNGNPLYTRLKSINTFSLYKQNSPLTENAYVAQCPSGYSQHTAVIDQDCLVNYCVKANAFGEHGEIPVVLPPFRDFHTLFNDTTPKQIPSVISHGVSAGTITSIVLASFFACLSLMLLILNMRMKRQQLSRQSYLPISEEQTLLNSEIN